MPIHTLTIPYPEALPAAVGVTPEEAVLDEIGAKADEAAAQSQALVATLSVPCSGPRRRCWRACWQTWARGNARLAAATKT